MLILSRPKETNQKRGPVSSSRPCILVYFGPPFIKIVFTADSIVYTFNIRTLFLIQYDELNEFLYFKPSSFFRWQCNLKISKLS